MSRKPSKARVVFALNEKGMLEYFRRIPEILARGEASFEVDSSMYQMRYVVEGDDPVKDDDVAYAVDASLEPYLLDGFADEVTQQPGWERAKRLWQAASPAAPLSEAARNILTKALEEAREDGPSQQLYEFTFIGEHYEQIARRARRLRRRNRPAMARKHYRILRQGSRRPTENVGHGYGCHQHDN